MGKGLIQTNNFKKGGLRSLGDSLGRDILEEFSSLDIITFEPSREAPLRKYPAQRLKRHLRSYVIEPKVRFNTPFLNFWFALVFPFESELERRGAF